MRQGGELRGKYAQDSGLTWEGSLLGALHWGSSAQVLL